MGLTKDEGEEKCLPTCKVAANGPDIIRLAFRDPSHSRHSILSKFYLLIHKLKY